MRIADCFRYSQNGTSPPADSEEVLALMAYTNWLATGLPIGITPKASGYPALATPAMKPDRRRGEAVYAANCAVCHGANGQGSAFARRAGDPGALGPAVVQLGRGHAFRRQRRRVRLREHAARRHGTLTEQQAWDVAAWIDSQPRPQDPRFTESAEKTRELYHKRHAYEYYGETVDGMTLGAPGMLEAWTKKTVAAGARWPRIGCSRLARLDGSRPCSVAKTTRSRVLARGSPRRCPRRRCARSGSDGLELSTNLLRVAVDRIRGDCAGDSLRRRAADREMHALAGQFRDRGVRH